MSKCQGNHYNLMLLMISLLQQVVNCQVNISIYYNPSDNINVTGNARKWNNPRFTRVRIIIKINFTSSFTLTHLGLPSPDLLMLK